MHVTEVRLREVLEGSKQYRVPLYQRTYAWTGTQLTRLWDDIVALAERRAIESGATHFTGSLVLSTGFAGPGGSAFLVVDGQQRLTTLSLLVAALRDHLREVAPDNRALWERLQDNYLLDRYKSGDDRLKLLPTQADRDAFRSILDGTPPTDPQSGIATAYRFFRSHLVEIDDPEDDADIAAIEAAVLDGLVFVSITANADDNVYRIFESLNNTGMRLTQGDLLRNYIFMRLENHAEKVYQSIWLPMQTALGVTASGEADGTARLEQLFWMVTTWDDPLAKVSSIYALQQARLNRLTASEVETEVRRFKRIAELFLTIEDPSRERNVAIRTRLQRLREWGSISQTPFVLRLLDLRDSGVVDAPAVARSLLLLESFLVRRLLVKAPSNALSRILLRASSELDADRPVESLHRYLSGGRKYFATDRQVRDAVTTTPFYWSGTPTQRKTFLSWLEQLEAGREPAALTAATIEHVLPQTLTDEWRLHLEDDLGAFADADAVHDAYLHTLANLTLSAYNSELSNAPFEKKRVKLAESNIALNTPIARVDRWTRSAMDQRGKDLAAHITKAWPAPVDDVDLSEPSSTWRLVRAVVEAIPRGRWASYGDIAAVVGTHAVPLGSHVASHDIRNAWRVLQSSGSISGGFVWPASSPHHSADPHDVLREEGLRFDAAGRADPARRLSIDDIRLLVGESDAAEEPTEPR